MSEDELETQWLELLNLFRLSDSLKEQVLIQRIKALALPDDLCHALICSIEGNNRIINEYLFDLPVTYQQPVAWIAPVIVNGDKRYAWMIGQVSSEISEVRSRFDRASARVGDDSILMCKHEPKPLMFIEPLALSDFSESAESNGSEIDKTVDDFAVFQVGYKGTEGDIEDFDQRLVLNATLLEKNFNTAINRAAKVIDGLQEIDNYLLEQQAKLLAMIHAEAHNRGHFAGSWPFDKYKTCVLHEAVEEFRACLNAIRWTEHLNLTSYQADLFAFSVFAIRFFYYGYRAYVEPIKTHQSIRETSVGLMFFETLNQSRVFCIDPNKKIFHRFKITQVRPALIAAAEKLNQQEFKARSQGTEGLREVGRYWYQLAYPNSNLSPEAQSIYTNLRNFVTV
ncbi:hypothetical protein [Limnofasciculus baicalensis]|uniref:Uncharacterized protein n=1 Tax=Limnofasciculus baicalensis BBK-W-15 TaxID=2699891 RepID=A0AAE3GVC5_9CYAN|nr:hypothetical protein [Limnofasciculus baicalensis]MCP2731366.1 hypothetical protein [Limnofasciculus baicalensis BBK-W-15]